MNYCRYRFPSLNESIISSEREWNQLPAVPSSIPTYYKEMKNAHFYMKCAREMHPHYINYRSEYFPLKRRRFSGHMNAFRRPCSRYALTFCEQTSPECARQCRATDLENGCMAQIPVHRVKYGLNNSHSQTENEIISEINIENGQEGTRLKKNFSNARKLSQTNSRHSATKNVNSCHSRSDEWNRETSQFKNDYQLDQNTDIQAHQEPRDDAAANFFNDISYMTLSDHELGKDAVPVEFPLTDPLISGMPVTVESMSVNDSFQIENAIKDANVANSCVQIQNSEKSENNFEDLEKALNSIDENSLTEYFLKNLYSFSESESQISKSPKNLNFSGFPETDFKKQMHTNSITDSFQEITCLNLDDIKTEDLIKTDENFISEFLNEIAENVSITDTEKHSEESMENENSNTNGQLKNSDQTQERFTASDITIQNNDGESLNNQDNESSFDRSHALFDEQKNNDERPKYIENSNSNQISSKNTESKYIFHAPVINIYQHNRISTDDSHTYSTVEQSCESIKSSFNYKMHSHFMNNLMKTTGNQLNKTHLERQFLKSIPEDNFKGEEFYTLNGEGSSAPNCSNIELNKLDIVSNKDNDSEKILFEQFLSNFINENEASCSVNNVDENSENRKMMSKTIDHTSSPISSNNKKRKRSLFNNKTINKSFRRKKQRSSKENASKKISVDALLTANSDLTSNYPMQNSSINNPESLILDANTKHEKDESNLLSPILMDVKLKESSFVYSDILNSHSLLNQLDTSLSSVTNSILDNPCDTESLKNFCIMNESEYSEVSHEKQQIDIKCSRKEKPRFRKENNFGIKMSKSNDKYMVSHGILNDIPDKVNDNIPDDLFESDIYKCSPLVSTPKIEKKNGNYSCNKKKYNLRGKATMNSSESLCHMNTVNGNKENALNKSSYKSYRDISAQTLETNTVVHCDATTQTLPENFNISHDVSMQTSLENSNASVKTEEDFYSNAYVEVQCNDSDLYPVDFIDDHEIEDLKSKNTAIFNETHPRVKSEGSNEIKTECETLTWKYRTRQSKKHEKENASFTTNLIILNISSDSDTSKSIVLPDSFSEQTKEPKSFAETIKNESQNSENRISSVDLQLHSEKSVKTTKTKRERTISDNSVQDKISPKDMRQDSPNNKRICTRQATRTLKNITPKNDVKSHKKTKSHNRRFKRKFSSL